jgi:hypothetical protein
MANRYPLSACNERELPEGYDGPAYVWDIDKTYLSTNFSSLGGLLRIPLEFAVDKIANPGMPEVIRGLRRGPGEEYAGVPLYFVSASPPQLRRVLEHKMLIDGVEFDGITSKDWLKTLLEFKPGRLKEQVGFKVCALLAGRLDRPSSREYLFGDDVEQDAAAFHLYARMVNREISPGDAATALRKHKVEKEDRKSAFSLLETLPRKLGRVERIFITLEKNTPPEKFEKYSGMVVPVRGAGQLFLPLRAGPHRPRRGQARHRGGNGKVALSGIARRAAGRGRPGAKTHIAGEPVRAGARHRPRLT